MLDLKSRRLATYILNRLSSANRINTAYERVSDSQSPRAITVMAAPPTMTHADASVTSIAGGISHNPLNNTAKFRWLCPGGCTAGSGGLVGNWTSSRDPSDPVIVDFMTDASIIEVRFLNYVTAVGIFVDGQPVQSTAYTTGAAGSAHLWKLDFTADSDPAKVRHIRVEGVNLVLTTIYTNATASIWAPDPSTRKLLAVMGDSYVQGTGAVQSQRHVGTLIAHLLGMDHYWEGVGGTGWTSAGSNAPATRIQNRIGALNRKPDYLFIPFGYNDKAAADFTAHGTAFDAMMAAIRNYLPQTKVIIGAPWTPLGTQADLTNVRAFNLAKASEYGLPFLDIDNLVNASNKSIYTGGDNVHPTVAGHYYLAQRIAQKLIPYIA